MLSDYYIQAHFILKFSPLTVALAVNYMDRYLAKNMSMVNINLLIHSSLFLISTSIYNHIHILRNFLVHCMWSLIWLTDLLRRARFPLLVWSIKLILPYIYDSWRLNNPISFKIYLSLKASNPAALSLIYPYLYTLLSLSSLPLSSSLSCAIH